MADGIGPELVSMLCQSRWLVRTFRSDGGWHRFESVGLQGRPILRFPVQLTRLSIRSSTRGTPSPRGTRENLTPGNKKVPAQKARGTRGLLASSFTWQQYAANHHGYSVFKQLVATPGLAVNPDQLKMPSGGSDRRSSPGKTLSTARTCN